MTYPTVQIHVLHPRPLKTESITLMEFYSGQPDILAASVRDYCTGVLTINRNKKKAPKGFAKRQVYSRRFKLISILMKIKFISMLRLKSSFRKSLRMVFKRLAAMRRKRLDFFRKYFIVVSFVNKQGLKTRLDRGAVNTRIAPRRAWCLQLPESCKSSRPLFTEAASHIWAKLIRVTGLMVESIRRNLRIEAYSATG